jgi:tetratricopeptide (TPR) repeat protein
MKRIVFIFFTFSFLFADTEFDKIKTQYFKSYDYEQMGKYSEAIKVLSPLYRRYPKGYTLNLRFGWLFFLDKKYNNAIKYYQKASLINTYALDPKLGLIRIYLATSSYKKAQTTATSILKIDFYNYYANLYMIKTLIAERKYDIASKNLEKMLALYPTDVLFLEELLRIYKYTKNKGFKKLQGDILILDPNNIMARSVET